ncbi:MAG: hypothetical protein ACRDQA_17035 [Nocardioidaceae bacterium]
MKNYDGFDGDAPGATWIDYAAGAAEVKAATYSVVPSVVLVKTPGRWDEPPLPDIDERWSAGQDQLAQLTGATRIDALDADHFIQTDAPDLVALAIEAVVATVSSGHHAVQLDATAVASVGGRIAGGADIT